MCGCNSLPGKCCCTSGGSAGALCECSNLEIEDSILHTGNVCTYIGFDTNQITIDACGPKIVLDNALSNKITHTGQTQFVNNVGIGTTPAYPLEVNGSAKVTTLRDTSNSVGTAGQLLSSTGSALQWVAAPTPVVPAAPVNSIQFNNAGSFGGDSDFTFDSSTNTVRVNGKTVVGSNSANALEVFSNGDTEIGFSYSTVGNIYGKIIGDIVTASPLEGEIAFQTAASATLAERMRITKNGNVGIGTATPAYPLDVIGSAKFTTIRDTANSVGTAGQVLSSTGSALQWVAGGGSLPSAVVRETKTANVNSAVTWVAGTTGNLQKRQFNVVANSGMSVTVSGSPNWTFTIPTAGTYFFEARATIRTPSSDGQTVYGKLVLNNNTLGLGSVIVGDSHTLGPISGSILGNTNWTHHLSGFYAITGSTVFSLDHIIASQFFAPIGGLASNLLGYDEVYSVVNITKIS